jgi:very-short-patch-repair endonuclease
LYDGKREVRVYDYADLNVPMLARMFDRRCRGYEAIGYRILLPASAIPGWPMDVVLPSDPVWKRDYSGSVRRLVRDGVDTPLARLFVHSARTVHPDTDGADRARSATEAFLYQRLETLSETKGRFRINVGLPIAFDGFGTLEVDLLCADARVAVELDGAHHLADPVAYRRDRRKDQLLQENGYLVLRFLAEDVGKELDLVLDTILRSLSHRRASAAVVQTLTIARRTRFGNWRGKPKIHGHGEQPTRFAHCLCTCARQHDLPPTTDHQRRSVARTVGVSSMFNVG